MARPPCLPRVWLGVLFLALAPSLPAEIRIGDTAEAVRAEKGAPLGKMQFGDTEILRFADQTVKLKAGRVIAVEAVVNRPAPPPAPVKPKRLEPAAPPPLPETPPEYPQSFVGTPEFRTTLGLFTGGTAFLTKMEGSADVYLVTMHRLFSAAAGFGGGVSHPDLPKYVHGVRLKGLVGPGLVLDLHPLVLPDDPRNPVSDLAVMRSETAPAAEAVVLATEPALPGAPVWLFARSGTSTAKADMIHRGRVIEFRGRFIVCEFEDAELAITQGLGAPALGADGKVVGILARSLTAEGKKYAAFIPAAAVIAAIGN